MPKKKLSATKRNAEIYRILSVFLKDKKSVAEFSAPFDLDEIEKLS